MSDQYPDNTETGPVYEVKLELGPSDQLTAVHRYATSQTRYVWWDNGAWTGGVLSTESGPAKGGNHALALDSHGMPAVSYTLGSGLGSNVYLLRWLGATWGGLGGSATEPGISEISINTPSVIGFDENDNLFVGWYTGYGSPVYLSKWSENAWSTVTSVSSTNPMDQLGFAIGPGAIALAWPQAGGIVLRQWNNSEWSPDTIVGGGTDGNIATNPSVVFDAQGAPIVAWYEHSYPFYAIYVRRWDGITWAALGTGSDSGAGLAAGYTSAETPRLRINGSKLCVGWRLGLNGSTYALQCTTL